MRKPACRRPPDEAVLRPGDLLGLSLATLGESVDEIVSPSMQGDRPGEPIGMSARVA